VGTVGAAARTWGRSGRQEVGWGGASHRDSTSTRSRMVSQGPTESRVRLTPPGDARCPAQEATLARVLRSSWEGTKPAFSPVGSRITSQILGSWLPTRVRGGMVLSVVLWLRLGIQATAARCAGQRWPRPFCSLDTTLSSETSPLLPATCPHSPWKTLIRSSTHKRK